MSITDVSALREICLKGQHFDDIILCSKFLFSKY